VRPKPYARYSTQHLGDMEYEAVLEAMWSNHLTQGPLVEQFESALAAYVGAKYAVACNSGTAALHLAIAATTNYGWNVLTSPLSFVATANAIDMAQCNPGFGDVDMATGNLSEPTGRFGYYHSDEDLRSRGLNPYGNRAPHLVVPVHYAGRACDLGIFTASIVEDACHALGAMDYDGCSRVGSCRHSLATCFSFHPVKPITTGEGGAVTTNDPTIAARMRLVRSHGRDANGEMIAMGYNYRMGELAAALGLAQLKRCDTMRHLRVRLAADYYNELLGLHGKGLLLPPLPDDKAQDRNAWHLFPVRITQGRRDDVKAALLAKGIGVQVHYKPIHEQPYYVVRHAHPAELYPNAHTWGQEELSLPLHAGMSSADVLYVVAALREALRPNSA